MNGAGRPVAVLVGLPGAGKTTIGRKLARRLDVGFHDTDQMIEACEGRAVAEIFAQDGEPAFRALEEQTVCEALDTFDGVLSLGGGAVLSPVTRAHLLGHRVVHLTIGVAEGVRRSQGSSRPLLTGGDVTAKFQALLTERAPLYREVAWTTVTTERRSSGKVVTEIVDKLRAGNPHLRSDGSVGSNR